MTTLAKVRADFIALYTRDVEQFPDTYKASVVNNPLGAAQVIMHGLAAEEVGRLLRDLKAERRRLGA